MGVYIVERYLPGLRPQELALVLARLASAEAGVRYLGSSIVPEDEACFCQFEAPSAEAVAKANERARLPFDRIVAVLAVTPRNEGRKA